MTDGQLALIFAAGFVCPFVWSAFADLVIDLGETVLMELGQWWDRLYLARTAVNEKARPGNGR